MPTGSAVSATATTAARIRNRGRRKRGGTTGYIRFIFAGCGAWTKNMRTSCANEPLPGTQQQTLEIEKKSTPLGVGVLLILQRAAMYVNELHAEQQSSTVARMGSPCLHRPRRRRGLRDGGRDL